VVGVVVGVTIGVGVWVVVAVVGVVVVWVGVAVGDVVVVAGTVGVSVAVGVGVGVGVWVVVGVAVVISMMQEQENEMKMANKKKQASWAGLIAVTSLGQSVMIRTVTHYYTGRIIALTPHEVVLDEAAWIADTGRFSVAMATGVLDEVEPYPDGVSVMRGAIVDCAPWNHPLPREMK